MIKEVKKEAPGPTPPPKKPNIFLRGIAFLVTVLLVLGAIYLVVNRDKLNFDALKRWFTYRTLAQSDTTGGGEPFSYQGGGTMSLVNCGGDLLSVSETGVRLYSPGGVAYIEETATLTHPVCQVSGKSAVAYDAGGSFLRVYKNRNQVFDLGNDNATILSARLNGSGYLTVVTRSSGYKGMVTVYNSNYQPLVDLRLSSSFVLDGIVSPDNRSLLVVTAGQENRIFHCALAQYSLHDLDPEAPTPINTLSLGSNLPLDLVWDNGGIRVLTEYSAISADGSLNQTGQSNWSDRHLKRSSLGGDGVFTLLTGKYHAGSQTDLSIINQQGEIVSSLEQTRPILSISAAGKYIAVLTAEKLDIYTQDLHLYSTTANTQGASRVALVADGSAYLATQDMAWLYLPS